MSELATVGIDLAKSVFQIHGIDKNGQVLVHRLLHRSQLLSFFEEHVRCLIGVEPFSDAYDWGRDRRSRRGADHRTGHHSSDPCAERSRLRIRGTRRRSPGIGQSGPRACSTSGVSEEGQDCRLSRQPWSLCFRAYGVDRHIHAGNRSAAKPPESR